MKKNVVVLFLLLTGLGMLVACSDDKNSDPEAEKAAPRVEWPANPDFAAVEIRQDMTGQAVIVVKAESGIKDFKLKIASDVLTNDALGAIGLSADMDLINDEAVVGVLGEFGMPVGAALKGAVDVNFDVSGLVPMILTLQPAHSGNHVFTLNVTDNAGRHVEKALTFHYTAPSSFTVSNIDLWKNTATVSAENLPEGAKVQYRLLNEEAWQEATAGNDGTFTINATWTEGTNAAGLKVYTVDTKTGVFAGHTYQLRAVKGEEVVGTGDFETEAGDVIPNGDMSGWSEREMKNLTGKPVNVAYPNAAGNSFWGCGNNGITTTLCTAEAVGDNTCAKLKAVNMFVLAAGNLFTGSFEYANMSGTVSFGQAYNYSARPVGMKVRYKGTIGVVDVNKHNGPLAKGEPDKARIFVSIVDWSAPHQVTSGISSATGMWDPETMAGLEANETVIAYGTKLITESTVGEDFVELTLPLNYYNKDAVAPTGNYTLVISCSTSVYGDYMNGCSTNELYVDDFQWVY